jgi:hypothetical protein
VVRDDADTFLRVAPIVDKDADEQAARLSFPNPDGQVLIELCEPAGLQDVGENIGGDFSVPAFEAAHAIRCEIGGDERHHQRHNHGGIQEREE